MRKVRDYDAELKALNDKARSLRAKRVEQLGQLVAATGADALDAETLAGVLLQGVRESKVAATREAWRVDGAAFFQRRGRKGSGAAAAIDGSGATAEPGGDAAGGSGGTANG